MATTLNLMHRSAYTICYKQSEQDFEDDPRNIIYDQTLYPLFSLFGLLPGRANSTIDTLLYNECQLGNALAIITSLVYKAEIQKIEIEEHEATYLELLHTSHKIASIALQLLSDACPSPLDNAHPPIKEFLLASCADKTEEEKAILREKLKELMTRPGGILDLLKDKIPQATEIPPLKGSASDLLEQTLGSAPKGIWLLELISIEEEPLCIVLLKHDATSIDLIFSHNEQYKVYPLSYEAQGPLSISQQLARNFPGFNFKSLHSYSDSEPYHLIEHPDRIIFQGERPNLTKATYWQNPLNGKILDDFLTRLCEIFNTTKDTIGWQLTRMIETSVADGCAMEITAQLQKRINSTLNEPITINWDRCITAELLLIYNELIVFLEKNFLKKDPPASNSNISSLAQSFIWAHNDRKKDSSFIPAVALEQYKTEIKELMSKWLPQTVTEIRASLSSRFDSKLQSKIALLNTLSDFSSQVWQVKLEKQAEVIIIEKSETEKIPFKIRIIFPTGQCQTHHLSSPEKCLDLLDTTFSPSFYIKSIRSFIEETNPLHFVAKPLYKFFNKSLEAAVTLYDAYSKPFQLPQDKIGRENRLSLKFQAHVKNHGKSEFPPHTLTFIHKTGRTFTDPLSQLCLENPALYKGAFKGFLDGQFDSKEMLGLEIVYSPPDDQALLKIGNQFLSEDSTALAEKLRKARPYPSLGYLYRMAQFSFLYPDTPLTEICTKEWSYQDKAMVNYLDLSIELAGVLNLLYRFAAEDPDAILDKRYLMLRNCSAFNSSEFSQDPSKFTKIPDAVKKIEQAIEAMLRDPLKIEQAEVVVRTQSEGLTKKSVKEKIDSLEGTNVIILHFQELRRPQEITVTSLLSGEKRETAFKPREEEALLIRRSQSDPKLFEICLPALGVISPIDPEGIFRQIQAVHGEVCFSKMYQLIRREIVMPEFVESESEDSFIDEKLIS